MPKCSAPSPHGSKRAVWRCGLCLKIVEVRRERELAALGRLGIVAAVAVTVARAYFFTHAPLPRPAPARSVRCVRFWQSSRGRR